MGRMKRTSKVLDKANARAAGLRAIGPFDFGNGLNTAAFDGALSDTHAKLDEYNQALSAVDDKYNALLAAEKTLKDLSERCSPGSQPDSARTAPSTNKRAASVRASASAPLPARAHHSPHPQPTTSEPQRAKRRAAG